MKSIKLETFINFNFLGQVKTSPERTKYGFIQSVAHREKNEYHHTLYVSSRGKIEKVRKLKTNHDFLFLNEDLVLLDLQKNQDERDQLNNHYRKSFYIYDLERSSLEKAFTLPLNASLVDVIDEDTLLISAQLTTSDHVLYNGSKQERSLYIEKKEKASQYEDIDEMPYYFNDRGFKTGEKKQIFIYHIQSKKIEALLDPHFSVEDIVLSRNKSRIIFTGKQDEKVQSLTSKIYQYDLESKSINVLYDQDKYSVKKIVDMSRLIVFASDMNTYGINQNPDIYELVDGEMKLLSYYGFSFGNSIGSDCRLLGSIESDHAINQFYFISTVEDHSVIKVLSPNGDIDTFFDMDGSIDGLIHMNDHLILIAMKGQGLQEIYQLDFDGSLTQLTSFNESSLKNRYVAQPKAVKCQKHEFDVDGFVLLPETFDVNQQYPMILDIHGGPKTVYGKNYYHEMQYWANQGYIVAYANPRGSDGKGNAFADIRGKYGTIDYEDLMDFLNQVIWEYPAIDQSRMYVTGGSYGGFMTNWIVGHTDRFSAAVTQRSISNWLSFYGTSDIGFYFAKDQTAGHPIQDLDLLYKQSPIKYAMNVKTPLRFIHSDKDYRCPMEQAQQLYAVLKTNGLETDLIWFKEETHELSRGGKPQARIKRLRDITEWFENH